MSRKLGLEGSHIDASEIVERLGKDAMGYIMPTEIDQECEELIDKICSTLITQQKYCLEVSGKAWDKDGVSFELRRPNFEAVSHAHDLLSIHYAPSMGHLVQYNEVFIGEINYWEREGKHFITNSHIIDARKSGFKLVSEDGEQIQNYTINMSTIISLRNFLVQIRNSDQEQIRKLEKVLFCFET